MLIVACFGAGSRATAMIDQCASLPVRNRLILLIFLLVCRRLHLPSCIHDVPAWKTRHKDWFSVEAAKPTAPMTPRSLFLTPHLVGKASPIVLYITYIFLHRTQPTKTPLCWHAWPKPKWSMVATKVPHSRPCPIQQSPSMLSDCRMRWHQECGTMVAVDNSGCHGWWVCGLASCS